MSLLRKQAVSSLWKDWRKQRRGGTQIILMFSVCTLPPLEHCDSSVRVAAGSSDPRSQLPPSATASSCGPCSFDSIWHVSWARQTSVSLTETEWSPSSYERGATQLKHNASDTDMLKRSAGKLSSAIFHIINFNKLHCSLVFLVTF